MDELKSFNIDNDLVIATILLITLIEALTTKNYNVILMDIQMLQMDGIEATKVIHQRDMVQSYIVAMTANAMENDREQYLQAV